MTKAEKISVTTLQAQNRALRADVLTATATLRRYTEAHVGVNVVVQDTIKCQLVAHVCLYHSLSRVLDDKYCRPHVMAVSVFAVDLFWVLSMYRGTSRGR